MCPEVYLLGDSKPNQVHKEDREQVELRNGIEPDTMATDGRKGLAGATTELLEQVK